MARESERLIEQMPARTLPVKPPRANGPSPQGAAGYLQQAAGNESTGEAIRQGLLSSGSPLDQQTRQIMEDRFAQNFADVRVHTDQAASESAKGFAARAYTLGRDVFFETGAYEPTSARGTRLLAHELAHVAQRRNAGGRMPDELVSNPVEPGEREARVAGERAAFAQPGSLAVRAAPSAAVSREPAGEGSEEESPWGNFVGPALKVLGPLASTVVPGAGVVTEATETALAGKETLEAKSAPEQVFQGLKTATGLAGTTAEVGGFELLGAEGAGGMALGDLGGAAAAGELGTMGMLGPGAAVAGSFFGGWELGKGLDSLSNYVGQKVTGNKGKDYSLSGMSADYMVGQDQAFTSAMRGLGLYDKSKPEYTQTLGWKLGEATDYVSEKASAGWQGTKNAVGGAWDWMKGLF
ncbi:MAG TPA: DUF4157 domain-containing protein [Candidatus Limnocylindrales bacterium]|nr:DUF4157 domain-containing protein [Candidatus Limnocylindrales bacterium]